MKLKNILLIGSDSETASIERKRNKILNFLCLFSAFTTVFFTILDFFQGIVTLPIALNFVVQIGLVFLIIFFNYKQKWQTARLLFILQVIFVLTLQNNFLFKGFYGEYLYLAIPLFSMFFFDRKVFHFFYLSLSIALFYLPNLYLKIYPDIYFGYTNVLFLFVGTFSILYFFKNENLKNEAKLTTANKKLDEAFKKLQIANKNELAVLNLKALQSQMNPHFIFNVLNAVQDLVLREDIKQTNKYLSMFSDLIRKVLVSSKQQFITLKQEIEILSIYLDFEKLRFGDKYIIDIQCNISEMEQNEIMLPTMFIQQYVENALKNGLFHKEGVKKLNVYFNLKNDVLECIIKDNGVGQEKAAEFKLKSQHLHEGFSAEAVKKRFNLLNETLGNKIQVETTDLFLDKVLIGTKTIINIPFMY